MLIVAEPTRLFRNVADVGNWLATVNVPVFSVAHGRILGRRALVSAAEEGSDFAAKTREGTAAKKRVFSVKDVSQALGARQKGQRNSLVARKLKADQLARDIGMVLSEVGCGERLSHRQLVDQLNLRGIRTQQGKRWTVGNIRRPRETAEELLREEREMLCEVFPVQTVGLVPDVADAPAKTEYDPQEAEMRKLTTFGMF